MSQQRVNVINNHYHRSLEKSTLS